MDRESNSLVVELIRTASILIAAILAALGFRWCNGWCSGKKKSRRRRKSPATARRKTTTDPTFAKRVDQLKDVIVPRPTGENAKLPATFQDAMESVLKNGTHKKK